MDDKTRAVEHYTAMAEQAQALFEQNDRLPWQTYASVFHGKAPRASVYVTGEDRRVSISWADGDGNCTLRRLTPREAVGLAAELVSAACASAVKVAQ